MSESAIRLDHVSKRYRLYRRRHQSLKEVLVRRSFGEWRDLWALDDVTIDIPQGQIVGIIGENGSGKSTTLKVLSGIVFPDRGVARVRGRVTSLLELGAGFQPEYSGRENIHLYGALLGLRRAEIDAGIDAIIEFSELGSRIEDPVKNYSSGMYMRLGFSIAVHLHPDVLLIDEVLAVGDAAFQRKCYARLAELHDGGCTILLVSHDLESVERFCQRGIWLHRGRVAADGPVAETIERYLDISSRPLSERELGLPGVDRSVPSGDVHVVSARILNAHGAEARHLTSGEAATLEVRYLADAEVSGAAFSFTVNRNDGLRCVETPSETGGTYTLPRGEGVARLHLPRLGLHGGLYNGSIAIYEPASGRLHDHQDRMLPFSVVDPREGTAVAWLDYEWELEPALASKRARPEANRPAV
ncbi:MAG TPA: ABC transporter ATP-binding protein [Candidatus Dormibacteraeota bacterium]